MNETLISVANVHKSFETPASKLEILRGVNLLIKKADLCFILGRSGAGKSTLLHLMASLDMPNSGNIFFRDKDLTKMKAGELARYRGQRTGFIFQFYYLLPELSLLENVMLPALIAKKKKVKDQALELLRKMGLKDRAGHFPNQLSGGEQQRAAVARALINAPDIVFCDEPTGNLDDETAREVYGLITDLNQKEGQTFCIVTHEESLIGSNHLVYHLHEGRLALRDRG